jgi:xylose isomerase
VVASANLGKIEAGMAQKMAATGLKLLWGTANLFTHPRRQSVDPADLYLAHIGGIDTIARALLAAADVVSDGGLERLKQERYQGWNGDLGKRITGGELNLATLADLATEKGLDPAPRSGRQELAESLIARHCKY